MTANVLAAPASDATAEDQVDWLELTAFFDRFGRAHLDQIAGAIEIQKDENEENTGDADAENDQVRESIESEVLRRHAALGEAYPFTLSNDGEFLRYKPHDERRGTSFYLLCLVLSHITRSSILKRPPHDAAIRGVRKRQFQIFSTLAVAGAAGGTALSLGWPRTKSTTILNVVRDACVRSGTGQERVTPAPTANPAAKDGGIDVLAWTPATHRPPPTTFWFGQAASGHGWRSKSARDDHAEFIRDYFDVGPQCNYSFVTICPFLVSEFWMQSASQRHGTLLDRTRAPFAALQGFDLATAGVYVEEVDKASAIPVWLATYRRRHRILA